MKRQPVEVYPLAYFLAEEMEERDWTTRNVAAQMPGDFGINALALDFLLTIHSEHVVITDDQARGIAAVFDVSPDLIKRLHRTWVENPSARVEWECPEHLLSGATFQTEH